MSVEKTVVYNVVCDECDALSEEYYYGSSESEEFKGRGVRYARTRASRSPSGVEQLITCSAE